MPRENPHEPARFGVDYSKLAKLDNMVSKALVRAGQKPGPKSKVLEKVEKASSSNGNIEELLEFLRKQ